MALKPVNSEENPGLSKLPTEVRNKMGYMKKGGKVKHSDMSKDIKTVKKAVSMHDKQQHGGKKTNLTALKKGGAMHKMPDGTMMAGKKHGMAAGGVTRGDGCVSKGRTKGTMIKMKKGGAC